MDVPIHGLRVASDRKATVAAIGLQFLPLTQSRREEQEMRKKKFYLLGAVAAGLVAIAISYVVGKHLGERAQETYESSMNEE